VAEGDSAGGGTETCLPSFEDAAAAFGAAYYNRDTLAQHWTWATSHLSFVGELWKGSESQLEPGVAEGDSAGGGTETCLPSFEDLDALRHARAALDVGDESLELCRRVVEAGGA
jgi:hypothetical protein